MRGISITVHSEHAYRDASDPQITIYNHRRINWPNEWRFITPASQARIIGIVGRSKPIAEFILLPDNDPWYGTNQDHSRITFVWSAV